MKVERNFENEKSGRYLCSSQSKQGSLKAGRYLAVVMLLAWDGLLLYMIVECLIEPVYGAAFMAVVSFYLGRK